MCSSKHFLPYFHGSLVLAKLEGMQDIGSKGRRLQLQRPLLRPPVLPYSVKASLLLTIVFLGVCDCYNSHITPQSSLLHCREFEQHQ